MSRTSIYRIRRAFVAVGLVALAGGSLAAPAAAADTGVQSTYLVLYTAGARTTGAQKAVESAGGTLVADYSAIGVVVARSSRSDFSAAVGRSRGVDSAVATGQFATKVTDTSSEQPVAAAAATWGDSLSGLQWDMRQINVPQAHAINSGIRSVVVGDIDTGLDFTHPDLAPNYDASRSTDCSSGTPQPLAVGNDKNGHGTHTAGTIAAAANGTGIVGVAPNVSIAGIKSSNDDGFFFPEMVICSFVWAATHGIDVTNNSYFADPWLFNCRNDAGQRAIWNAERRAIGYAQHNGVLVVAAEGNESTDLTHPTTDVVSPDFPPNSSVERDVTNACAVVPVEVPGVVGVTATGNKRLKSFYSSYGTSSADVAAPGGDSILQLTADAPNGRVLSTFSSVGTICLPRRLVVENGAKYCYLQGTSMASPHASGVAALLLSAHRAMTSGQLSAALQGATNALSCPDTSIYAAFPQNSGAPQTCQGGSGHNSFYGSGEVDALKAVQ
ncbi:S8 family peptidase [Kribbella qitaiheensis]|uniref:S8 family peptidase n=1 Tax=Kribbella qitaiheensis TaxID=1544730 RepID=UPI0019D54F53|nr:S8 family serine peptidase [Kribbella qitaiheensis]